MGERFGDPVPKITLNEITDKVIDGKRVPGMGWEISSETLRDIEIIEENARWALHRLRNILLG